MLMEMPFPGFISPVKKGEVVSSQQRGCFPGERNLWWQYLYKRQQGKAEGSRSIWEERVGSSPTAKEAEVSGSRAQRYHSQFPWASLLKEQSVEMTERQVEVELTRQRSSDRENITARETIVCWKLFALLLIFFSVLAMPWYGWAFSKSFPCGWGARGAVFHIS